MTPDWYIQWPDSPLTTKPTADTSFTEPETPSHYSTLLLHMFPSVLLIVSLDMNQQQTFPEGSQMAQDTQRYQQQPQWQPQQQPMGGAPIQQSQPQPQYVQMPVDSPTMQIPMQNVSTPQLDAMYSQGGPQQPVHQENAGYGQQGSVQQPQPFHDGNNAINEQMQQTPQNFAQQFPAQEYHQTAQFDLSMDTNAQPGQFQQDHRPLQQQAAPQAGYQLGPEGGQPIRPGSQSAHAGNVVADTDASAWEQAHVTKVNDNAGLNNQPSRPLPRKSRQQQQSQSLRELELHNARRRVEALEVEREQQEIAQALAASARDAPNFADIEEQLQQQIHQAQLLSLDAWEREVRWKIQEQQQQHSVNNQANSTYDGDGGLPWQGQPSTLPSHLGSNFSDPRHGVALNGPIPMMQGQMPPPPTPSARGSVSNLGFRSPTPRSQTPTRGIPLTDAARNAAAEDAQRWEAYHRGLNAHDGASVSTATEYTVIPEYSEASTARGGSKGKGRMTR